MSLFFKLAIGLLGAGVVVVGCQEAYSLSKDQQDWLGIHNHLKKKEVNSLVEKMKGNCTIEYKIIVPDGDPVYTEDISKVSKEELKGVIEALKNISNTICKDPVSKPIPVILEKSEHSGEWTYSFMALSLQPQ